MIICTFLLMPLVAGNYQVTIGETFTYTVNNSYWNIKYGAVGSTVSKCRIFLDSVPVGTSFGVEVTDVITFEEVSWNLTLGTNIYSWRNNPSDLGDFNVLLFNVRSQAFNIATFWSQENSDMGPTAQFLFFIDTADLPMFDFFRSLVDPSGVTDFTNTNNSFTQIEGHFDESGSVAVFDWVTEGSCDYTTPFDVHIEGSERFKVAYDKTTGVLQGYRIELNSLGTVEGQDFEMQMNQEITLDGYTLPAFYFDDPDVLPGFDWFISILAISTLIFTSVIIRKRKSSI